MTPSWRHQLGDKSPKGRVQKLLACSDAERAQPLLPLFAESSAPTPGLSNEEAQQPVGDPGALCDQWVSEEVEGKSGVWVRGVAGGGVPKAPGLEAFTWSLAKTFLAKGQASGILDICRGRRGDFAWGNQLHLCMSPRLGREAWGEEPPVQRKAAQWTFPWPCGLQPAPLPTPHARASG